MPLVANTKPRLIACLTGSAILSAVGEEVFRVALAWTSVELLGEAGGLVTALQVGAMLLASLIGGLWADGQQPRSLIFAGLTGRCVIILILGAAAVSGGLSLSILLPAVFLLACAGITMEPALQATIAEHLREPKPIQRANASIEVGRRLARAGGPALAAAIVATSGIPSLFFAAALAQSCSLAVASALPRKPREQAQSAAAPRSVLATLLFGFRLLKGRSFELHLMITRGIFSITWYIGLIVATALRLKQDPNAGADQFGLVMASYGAGALATVCVVAFLPTRTPNYTVAIGRLFGGFGFFLMGASSTLEWMMIGAAIASIGGPVEKIGIATVLQSRSRLDEIQAMVRMMLAIEMGLSLIVLASSPLLFAALGPGLLTSLCGLVCMSTIVWSFWSFDAAGNRRRRDDDDD